MTCPFTGSDAPNQTVLAIQTAERVNLDRRLTIRRAGFMRRLIKIKPLASPRQSRPYVEIVGDQKPRVPLGLSEQGGAKLTGAAGRRCVGGSDHRRSCPACLS